jgi:hypothetical protein
MAARVARRAAESYYPRMRKLRGSAVLFVLGALLLFAFASERASAKGDHPVDPDGLPSTSAKHPWKFFSGEARVDTLPFPIPDLVPAARREFESDNWIIFVEQPSQGLVVTKWKQIHHPLLWLFQGKTFARVTVQMRPLDDHRTQVAFHGELASHHSFQGSPILPAARRAYSRAASNWRRNVTRDLTSRGASR